MSRASALGDCVRASELLGERGEGAQRASESAPWAPARATQPLCERENFSVASFLLRMVLQLPSGYRERDAALDAALGTAGDRPSCGARAAAHRGDPALESLARSPGDHLWWAGSALSRSTPQWSSLRGRDVVDPRTGDSTWKSPVASSRGVSSGDRPAPVQRLSLARRPTSSASRNASVVSHGCFASIRIARSLVIWPDSTVSTQTFSSASANATTSGVPSNLPRYLRPWSRRRSTRSDWSTSACPSGARGSGG